MPAESAKVRTTDEKIALFRQCFAGREDVYGTYDLSTGKVWQVKGRVTRDVIYAHLKGKQPLGIYPLVKDRIRFLAMDLDHDDPMIARDCVVAARHYGIPAYVERSKSKGFHVWVFFQPKSVSARKARAVARLILEDIESPDTEIFPKQDALDDKTSHGNFINSPLNGALYSQARTVFVDENDYMQLYPDQWEFLGRIERVSEQQLDEIIEVNGLQLPRTDRSRAAPTPPRTSVQPISFGLPICTQRMLSEGVVANQRTACFRLAIQLRKTGLSYDLAVAVLNAWAPKNRPEDGKRVITPAEIVAQATWAYEKEYRGCGCDDPVVAGFCDPACPVSECSDGGRKDDPQRET